jgi:hypothetical protein
MAASLQSETTLVHVVTSTTCTACPSDLAAHQSIDQHVLATGQNTQAAASITPSPPAPVIGLCLARADADRCESERPSDSYSCCDPFSFIVNSYIS